MIFSTLTALAIPPTVEASEVVITEAIQIDDGGSASDRMAAVGADSEGNVHVVWSRSKMHLYYSMYSAKGDVLIKATQITNAGVHTIEHPDMVIDDEDRHTSPGLTREIPGKSCTLLFDLIIQQWMEKQAMTLHYLQSTISKFPQGKETEIGRQLISIVKEIFTLFGKTNTMSLTFTLNNLKSTMQCFSQITKQKQH